MVLFSCMLKEKTNYNGLVWILLSNWKIWPTKCVMQYCSYTQTVKSSPCHFLFSFPLPSFDCFHQMYVKCLYKAFLLAWESVYPFIISSHLNPFSFRLQFLCVLSLLQRKKSREENKDITGTAGICLMSYEMRLFRKQKNTSAKYDP